MQSASEESSSKRESTLVSRIWERFRPLARLLTITCCTLCLLEFLTAEAFYAARTAMPAQSHAWGNLFLSLTVLFAVGSMVLAFRAEWYEDETPLTIRLLISLIVVLVGVVLEVVFIALLQRSRHNSVRHNVSIKRPAADSRL